MQTKLSDPRRGPLVASPLRSLAKESVIRTLSAAGRLRAIKRALARRGDILVLTLHRIVPDSQVELCRSPRGMVLRESLFIKLIDYLREQAAVISPWDVAGLSANGYRPRVLLTFDDGWMDNALVAEPILSKAGIRACFFVVTALTGKIAPFWPEQMMAVLTLLRLQGKLSLLPAMLQELETSGANQRPLSPGSSDESLLTWLKQFPHDRLVEWSARMLSNLQGEGQSRPRTRSADPGEQLMSWKQVEALASAGHFIGSHTQTHALLPQLDPRNLYEELAGSRSALKEHLPATNFNRLWLSYPNGSATPTVTLAASEAGYSNAFSNSVGTWRGCGDPFLIPRVNVWDGTLVDSDGQFNESHVDYSLFWRSANAVA